MQPSSTTSYQTFRLQCAWQCALLHVRLLAPSLAHLHQMFKPSAATEQEIRPGINGGNEMRIRLHSGENFEKL